MNENISSPDSSGAEKRSAFVAAILTLIAPGLGLLYAGKGRVAVCVPFVLLAIIGVFSWLRLVLFPIGYWLLILVALLFLITLIFVSCRYARVAKNTPIFWYQRWYMYVIFVFASQPVYLFGLEGNSRPAIFGFETHHIPSRSMHPTLTQGDYILTDSWAYASTEITRGDIVTFNYSSAESGAFVARVIGLPGDEIEIIKGTVFFSSQRLDEPYVSVENNVRTAKTSHSTIVPEGRYFVLGDNRDNSADSRSRGFVLRENIRAKVSHIWFSANENGLQNERIGSLH